MRILVRVLLFPIRIGLSLVLLPCKFVCLFGTMMLSIVAFLIFILSIGIILLLGETKEGLQIMLLSYLISPYGIPALASLIISSIEKLNQIMARI